MLSPSGGGATAKIIRRAGWLTLAQYAAALLGLVNTVVVSRALGPEQFGLVALTTSYTGLMWGFVSFKAASVTTRYIAGYHASGHIHELGAVCKLGYAIDLGTAMVTTIVVSSTAGLVADGFLNKAFLAPYIVVSALSVPLYAMTGTSRAILMSLDRVIQAAAFLVLEKIIVLATTGLLLLSSLLKFEYVIVAQAAAQAIMGVSMVTAALRVLRSRGVVLHGIRLSIVRPIFDEIRKLFAWNYLLTTASTIMEQLPVLLLGRYESAAFAGVYKIAVSMVVVIGYVEHSLRKAIYPEFSKRLAVQGASALRSYSAGIGKRLGPTIGALTLLAVVAIHWLVPLILGASYAQSVVPMQILLIAAGFSGYFFWVEAYFFAMGDFRSWVLLYCSIHFIAIILVFLMLAFRLSAEPVMGLAVITAAAKSIFYISASRRATASKVGDA